MKSYSTDIAIVGGGAAGCIAAIRAKEMGTDVIIVEKALIVRSGSAGGGEKDIACHLNEGEPWDTDSVAKEWYVSGKTGNNPFLEPEVADINVTRIGEVVKRLEDYGLEFRRDETGRYFRSQGIGTPGKYLLWFKNGHEFKKRLERQTRLAGAKILERVCVTDLLISKDRGVSEKQVTGVMGFSIVDGEVYTISAKCVILATGEAIRLYSNNQSSNQWSTWHSPYNNGTAQAIAFEAGAEVTGLEFTRTSLHPYGMGATGSAVFFGFGGYLLNSKGERYMQRYHSLGEKAPRDMLVFATQREIEEGRGPCCVDVRHLSKDSINTMIELQTKEFLGYEYYYGQLGIDLTKDLLRIEVGSLFAAGGVLINGKCETSVKRLYAAGDCTHARAGLPMALTTGLEAGEQAANYAKSSSEKSNNSDPKALDEEEKRKKILAPLLCRSGLAPGEFVARLNKIMDNYVGWHRTESSLDMALAELSHLESIGNTLVARNLHELMRCHEAHHLLVVAKLVAFGAKERKESRDWHRRDDFPNEDSRFAGHIVLRSVEKEDGCGSSVNTRVTSSFRRVR